TTASNLQTAAPSSSGNVYTASMGTASRLTNRCVTSTLAKRPKTSASTRTPASGTAAPPAVIRPPFELVASFIAPPRLPERVGGVPWLVAVTLQTRGVGKCSREPEGQVRLKPDTTRGGTSGGGAGQTRRTGIPCCPTP